MSLRETEQHPRNERDRALDDQRVMTIPQWAEVNGFSIWTAQRLIKAGKAPPITQISDRRIGITGVPTFIFAGRYAVVGAQPSEVLISAITRASLEQRAGAA